MNQAQHWLLGPEPCGPYPPWMILGGLTVCYCHLPHIKPVYLVFIVLLIVEPMSYQPPPGYVVPSQRYVPQGYHYHPKGSVQNVYSNPFQQPFVPSQPNNTWSHYPLEPHEASSIHNPQSHSNHHLPSWPAPMGPPPNLYNPSDMSSRQSIPPFHNPAADRVYTDDDFLRETDSLIHGFKPSMTPPIAITNISASNCVPNITRDQPIAPSHIQGPSWGDFLISENHLREMDDLIHGFNPSMAPIPIANPHWELSRARVANATPRIPVDASLVQEIDDLPEHFELEPRQGRRPSWGPHRTRQTVRAETPRIAVDKDVLDDMDGLLRNFNPEATLPKTPVQGRNSNRGAEGRRRRSSAISSVGARLASGGSDGVEPSDDNQQSSVSQKRKARFAYMTDSWEPRKPQKRRPSNAESGLRISKGLLENSGCDWSRLKPGCVHLLAVNSAFMSMASTRISRGNLAPREQSVKYLPRSKEFSGKSHTYHLILSVCGMPGPYIMDLVEENVDIDGEDDDIFSELRHRETKFKIDWPGLTLPPDGFKVLKPDGQRRRRGDFATAVATRIAKLIIDAQRFGKRPSIPRVIDTVTKDWDLKRVDVTKIRLVSLNYFVSVKAWVPVLAVDTLGKED